MELVALRIKIGRKLVDTGSGKRQMQNAYPDFNSLPEAVRDSMDWSYFVDKYTAWQYDKQSGFGEVDAYNPDPDMQFGVFCVPKDFADAALEAFPKQIKQLSEAELEDFYDNRAHVHEHEYSYNESVLNGIRARYGEVVVAEDELIEFFTDTTEANKVQRIAEYEATKGKSLSNVQQTQVNLLTKMTSADCKAINSSHPSPGINKNNKRYYTDFKTTRNFTIRPKNA
jgi:hypothetical protein